MEKIRIWDKHPGSATLHSRAKQALLRSGRKRGTTCVQTGQHLVDGAALNPGETVEEEAAQGIQLKPHRLQLIRQQIPHLQPSKCPHNITDEQCCGSGIRCLFYPWIREPGWVKNQYPDPGWTSRIIFPRAWKQFFGLKYVNSLMRMRIRESFDPGYGLNIPDPQHCRREYFYSLIQHNNQRKESNVRKVTKNAFAPTVTIGPKLLKSHFLSSKTGKMKNFFKNQCCGSGTVTETIIKYVFGSAKAESYGSYGSGSVTQSLKLWVTKFKFTSSL